MVFRSIYKLTDLSDTLHASRARQCLPAAAKGRQNSPEATARSRLQPPDTNSRDERLGDVSKVQEHPRYGGMGHEAEAIEIKDMWAHKLESATDSAKYSRKLSPPISASNNYMLIHSKHIFAPRNSIASSWPRPSEVQNGFTKCCCCCVFYDWRPNTCARCGPDA